MKDDLEREKMEQVIVTVEDIKKYTYRKQYSEQAI